MSLCTVLLLTPNLAAAARTVLLFSTIYAASSQARSSMLLRMPSLPVRGFAARIFCFMYMTGRQDSMKASRRREPRLVKALNFGKRCNLSLIFPRINGNL